MPRLTYLGGVGAVGSAMACFFHPSKPIRDKWTQDNKRRLTGVLITDEAMWCVYKRDQDCYLVRIPEIDYGREFHIVKRNFKVDQAPLLPLTARPINSLSALPLPTTLNVGTSVMQCPASTGAQEF